MAKFYLIRLEGMKCGNCAKKVGDSLKELPGVQAVRFVSPERKMAAIQCNDGSGDQQQPIDLEALKKLIEDKGYQFVEVTEVEESALNQQASSSSDGCSVQ